MKVVRFFSVWLIKLINKGNTEGYRERPNNNNVPEGNFFIYYFHILEKIIFYFVK